MQPTLQVYFHNADFITAITMNEMEIDTRKFLLYLMYYYFLPLSVILLILSFNISIRRQFFTVLCIMDSMRYEYFRQC